MCMPKIALVTGANKGIGYEIAAQLAGLGMTVLLAARDPDRGMKAAETLRSTGCDAHPITLDVTLPATASAAATKIARQLGRLDVLINNAGISGSLSQQPPGTASLDTVRAVFDTNVFGVITVTNAMLPLLMRSPAPRIVNVSSSVGSLTAHSPSGPMAWLPGSAAYATSKTALNALTVQYAKELREAGVLVNAADPGGCDTDLTRPTGFPVHRTAAQGAAIAVRLATLGPDGPTGGFFNDDGPVPW
ncbi:SDR family oxidoreductase [Microtetraspora sp. NBRC 16547]|uniref:SDR family oxidoreductase n=1 Tax=Microtetraspora sp. NBRC 16547 TaxID=3030993 RepID=UPI002554F677|nr:SDR family oxidoreductase [Microtetraspora sp. NBRC 16547]